MRAYKRALRRAGLYNDWAHNRVIEKLGAWPVVVCQHSSPDECQSNMCNLWGHIPGPCFDKFHGLDFIGAREIDFQVITTCPWYPQYKEIDWLRHGPCNLHKRKGSPLYYYAYPNVIPGVINHWRATHG